MVEEYNNKYYRTIKVKPDDVKSSTYFDFGVENNEKDSKTRVGDIIRISKCKTFFKKSLHSTPT